IDHEGGAVRILWELDRNCCCRANFNSLESSTVRLQMPEQRQQSRLRLTKRLNRYFVRLRVKAEACGGLVHAAPIGLPPNRQRPQELLSGGPRHSGPLEAPPATPTASSPHAIHIFEIPSSDLHWCSGQAGEKLLESKWGCLARLLDPCCESLIPSLLRVNAWSS